MSLTDRLRLVLGLYRTENWRNQGYEHSDYTLNVENEDLGND